MNIILRFTQNLIQYNDEKSKNNRDKHNKFKIDNGYMIVNFSFEYHKEA